MRARPSFATRWASSSASNEFWHRAQGKFQKFGGYLSGMIIPVIGVIIAWGFLAMFFIPTAFDGATYVKEIGILVGPIINYVVPLLVGFMAGRLFYDLRGGIVGAFVTAGVIFGAQWWVNGVGAVPGPRFADGTSIFYDNFREIDGAQTAALGTTIYTNSFNPPNMLLGAMIAGSASAIIFKHLENLWKHRIPAGYEMLVNNYSIGVFGFAAILAAMFGITPVILYLMVALSIITRGIQSFNGLPLLSIIIEPAKPLFLNNAIGNGALVPVGLNEVRSGGKSILFFAEANPGPGLGMLAAFVWLGDKRERSQASAALPVHLIGGIHEVYFPFVLSNFALVLPLILAGAAGLGIMQAMDGGLNQPMSPGSIIAAYLSTSKTGLDYAAISVAMFGSAIISFGGAALYLRLKKRRTSLDAGAARLTSLKGRASKYVPGAPTTPVATTLPSGGPIRLVNVACDQGAGSSAAGATTLRNALKKQGITGVRVINSPLKEIDPHADMVVVLPGFAELATKYKPAAAALVIVPNMIGQQNFAEAVATIQTSQAATPPTAKPTSPEMDQAAPSSPAVTPPAPKVEVTEATTVTPQLSFTSRQMRISRGRTVKYAISLAGELLVKNGFVKKEYVAGMHLRDHQVSVAIGNGVAIPHGRDEDRALVRKTGLSLTLYPQGLDWHGHRVYVVIGIAARDDEHMAWISVIGTVFETPHFAARLAQAPDAAAVNAMLAAEYERQTHESA